MVFLFHFFTQFLSDFKSMLKKHFPLVVNSWGPFVAKHSVLIKTRKTNSALSKMYLSHYTTDIHFYDVSR